MSLPKSLAAFKDIEQVLDTVLRHDLYPARRVCTSAKAAINWRARANTFRAVLRKQEESRLDLAPGLGSSIYDDLVLSILPSEPKVVVIAKRSDGGALEIDGEVVSPVSDRELYAVEEINQEKQDDDENLDPFN